MIKKTHVIMIKTISLPDLEEGGVIKRYYEDEIYLVSKVFLYNAQKFGWAKQVNDQAAGSLVISEGEYV